MTLPVFWPSGDLFLSDSSGIWLSDAAFEELKKNKKTAWSPSLLSDPMLGEVQNIQGLETQVNLWLALLGQSPLLQKDVENIQLVEQQDDYLLRIEGKITQIPVLIAENSLAQYTVLDDAQNPLVLEFHLFPQAKTYEWFFSPLGFLKGLVDYRILEIAKVGSKVPVVGIEPTQDKPTRF